MKKLLLLSIFTAMFAGVQGQQLPETNTTITKGYGNFSIENVKYPLGSVIMNVRSNDTSLVELDFLYQNALVSVITPAKKRVKYINGTNGLPFASIGAFRYFYDSFMVVQPSSGGGGGGTEVDPVFTGSVAFGITNDNILQWNSALQNETDPAFSASAAFGISSGNISTWTSALQPSGNGSGLTSLNATNISSGTVAAARLGSTGTRNATTFLNGSNAWVAPFALTITGSGGAATFSSGTLNIPTPSGGLSPDGTSLQDNGDGTMSINLANGNNWSQTQTITVGGHATALAGLKLGALASTGINTLEYSAYLSWEASGRISSTATPQGFRSYCIPSTSSATSATLQFDFLNNATWSTNIASLSPTGVWKGSGLNLTSGSTITMTTTGSNNAAGTATLSSGTVTVSTSAVKTGDIVRINYTSGTALSIGVGNVSTMFTVPTITNGTSFVITALTVTGTTNTTDNSSVQWTLIHVQ